MKKYLASLALVFLCAASSESHASDVVMVGNETPVQGELFRVSVICPYPVEKAYVEFGGERVRLRGDGKRAAGYFGFDLAESPGEKTIVITIARGGEEVRIEKKIKLLDGNFPVERIDGVPDSYVTPDAEAMERIIRERSLLSSVWESSDEEIHWAGAFLPPIDGFEGKGFGKRRVINGQPRSPHTGLDCSAPEGTEVFSVNRGVVRVARDLFFSGNSVVVDHGGGIFSMYFHLKDIFVREGDFVGKGQVIGTVGATGRATGPHLHFGLRLVNERVNPENLFR